ncbi:TlpA family protein disulfide reductase, partial [Candidatus Thorarchaeota archaeon]
MEPEKMAITGLIMVVVVVGLVIGVSVFAYQAPDPEGSHTGDITFDTDLLSLDLQVPSSWEFDLSDGTTISFNDLIGKIVLVDLMATWCSTCSTQNSYLESVYDSMAGPLVILSLTVDRSETVAMMADYKSDRGLPWAHGLDTGAKFANYFSVAYVPTLVLIDSDGYFRYIHEGLWT